MGNAEGKIEFFQCSEGLLAEPRFIPEFEGVPQAFRAGEGREENAELLKSLLPKFESRRELPEHRPQLPFQWGGMVQEEGEGFPAILQSFDVCDEPASLDGKIKSFGSPFMPTLEDLFLGEAIKGDIQLDGIKILYIEFEPLSLREIGGIENPIPPMGVIVTAGTN